MHGLIKAQRRTKLRNSKYLPASFDSGGQAGENRNSRLPLRTSHGGQAKEIRNAEPKNRNLKRNGAFRASTFKILNLFRISSFGFRILHCRYGRRTDHHYSHS